MRTYRVSVGYRKPGAFPAYSIIPTDYTTVTVEAESENDARSKASDAVYANKSLGEVEHVRPGHAILMPER